MSNVSPRSDLARTILGVLFLGGLIVAAFWVLRPFVGPGIWATTIVVATWPLMLRLQSRLWNRRWLAVVVMTLLLLALFVLPVTLAVVALAQNVDVITAALKQLGTVTMPSPPNWLVSLPVVGPRIAAWWNTTATGGAAGVWTQVEPYVGQVAQWLLAQAGGVGTLLVQVLLVVVIAALMYAQGDVAAQGMLRFGRRLAGIHGESVVVLAGQAIRGVALGVGVTALVQAVIGGLGLLIVDVPYSGLLTLLMLVFCIAQIGPMPVLLPVVGWLYWKGDTTTATVLLVITLVAGTIDNFIRPMLIRMGADLPLLLIFGGVIGGLLAFGLVGIFVGPVVLAVAYTLVSAWVREGERAAAADERPAP
jgi:predicted PurR-regulated permease PerM